MKKIQCEICGSLELTKQGDFFVCDFCGCKYTLEDARKMMIEGTVDVSGSTVKVDTTDELKGRFLLALDKYKEGRYQETDNAIEEIIKINPKISDIWYLKSLIYRNTDFNKSKTYHDRAIENDNISLNVIDENKYTEMFGHKVTFVVSGKNVYSVKVNGILYKGKAGEKFDYYTKGDMTVCFGYGMAGPHTVTIEVKGDMTINAHNGMMGWKIKT